LPHSHLSPEALWGGVMPHSRESTIHCIPVWEITNRSQYQHSKWLFGLACQAPGGPAFYCSGNAFVSDERLCWQQIVQCIFHSIHSLSVLLILEFMKLVVRWVWRAVDWTCRDFTRTRSSSTLSRVTCARISGKFVWNITRSFAVSRWSVYLVEMAPSSVEAHHSGKNGTARLLPFSSACYLIWHFA